MRHATAGALMAVALACAGAVLAEPQLPSPDSYARERYAESLRLERNGEPRAALQALHDAGELGYGPAQRRLGELYDRGTATVPRDFAESIRWYYRAREQGEDIPLPHTLRAIPWAL